MKRLGSLLAQLGIACILVAGGTFIHAQPATHLDKHARKIQHKLAKYPSGRYLHLVMTDDSSAWGAVGKLTDTSFSFTSAESNTVSTYRYDDVARVKTDKEAIGEGTEPRRHIRHIIPIVIGAAALGAGAAVYEAVR